MLIMVNFMGFTEGFIDKSDVKEQQTEDQPSWKEEDWSEDVSILERSIPLISSGS